jgi:hypothetical protein
MTAAILALVPVIRLYGSNGPGPVLAICLSIPFLALSGVAGYTCAAQIRAPRTTDA